jgi:hypothetical protein
MWHTHWCTQGGAAGATTQGETEQQLQEGFAHTSIYYGPQTTSASIISALPIYMYDVIPARPRARSRLSPFIIVCIRALYYCKCMQGPTLSNVCPVRVAQTCSYSLGLCRGGSWRGLLVLVEGLQLQRLLLLGYYRALLQLRVPRPSRPAAVRKKRWRGKRTGGRRV